MKATELKAVITCRYSNKMLKAGSAWLLDELCRLAGNREEDVPYAVYTACYGIQWCVTSGRLSGTAAIRIRDMSATELFALVADVANECPTIGDVPSFLIKKLG